MTAHVAIACAIASLGVLCVLAAVITAGRSHRREP